ncbi:redoxin domain-containing protein [Phocaeicola sp.]
MKVFVNVLFTGVLAMAALSCSEEKKGYTLNGEISDVTEGMVYLKKYQDKSFISVDSAVITDGTFKFEGVCTEPLAYGLTTSGDSKRPLVFFLDNDKMQVKMNESGKELSVTGSTVNDLYAQNAPLTRQDGYNIDSLVAAHPASAVTPYFIVKDFAYKLNLEEMKALRGKLDASLDGTMYVNQMDDFIRRMENIQVGSVAPDFTLPDVEGNPVSLSSLRGKYVLIDFWASWCPDCRKENPNIVAAWEKFKNKNFTILGVSLDRKKEPWLAAIEKDQLTWTHVSDLKDWKSDAAVAYAIRWIPMNFLLDPDGVILATGLEGEALHQKLAEVLK